MLKLAQTDRQTNRQTDRPTNQQTGQKQYVPHYYRTMVLSRMDITSTRYAKSIFHSTGSRLMILAVTFVLYGNIIGTHLLTKFHEDWKINVASRVLTSKNAPPPGSHVFQPTGIIFNLFQDSISMNLLTKFHEDRTVNVASRGKNALPLESHEKCPAPGGHVFKATTTIFELIQDIIGTNVLTKFQDDWKINVTSRVFTRKMPRPDGGHVFQRTDINGMNLLTNFHEDWTKNVASRVKNAPPLGSHVFQANITIFELIQYIT
ncbi:hypothetical protein DPMN_080010 [Dreissena polymorpha]|uniref:Uncharacterized protein n=1 Tax=Dreissena polymorpha TaxID=45954 RepID=A0A9D3YT51_DREPO|nr:hypothetical protein DPMN_080010 [Dreissena polymorpha]